MTAKELEKLMIDMLSKPYGDKEKLVLDKAIKNTLEGEDSNGNTWKAYEHSIWA